MKVMLYNIPSKMEMILLIDVYILLHHLINLKLLQHFINIFYLINMLFLYHLINVLLLLDLKKYNVIDATLDASDVFVIFNICLLIKHMIYLPILHRLIDILSLHQLMYLLMMHHL